MLVTSDEEIDASGEFDFTTVGDDWTLFEYRAYYNHSESSMTFKLRDDTVLYPNQTVTFRTPADEFILPIEIPSNDPRLLVSARSADNVDLLIEDTSVFQADRVPHVRIFTYS